MPLLGGKGSFESEQAIRHVVDVLHHFRIQSLRVNLLRGAAVLVPEYDLHFLGSHLLLAVRRETATQYLERGMKAEMSRNPVPHSLLSRCRADSEFTHHNFEPERSAKLLEEDMSKKNTETLREGLDVKKLVESLRFRLHRTRSGGGLPTQPTIKSAVRSCRTLIPGPTLIG